MKTTILFSHLVFMCILLCSCSTTTLVASQRTDTNEKLYFDDYFIDYQLVPIESENDVFSIDDEMKEVVRTKLLSEEEPTYRAFKLLYHLFDPKNVNLTYKNNANLTAIQAYHSQVANCISLTIMAYVLAKEADLEVDFRDIKIPEYWISNGQYNMISGHVNLLIKGPATNIGSLISRDTLLIDFDSGITKNSFPKKSIDKLTILAMFYTNKGAEAMVNGLYTKAYAYLKQATLIAPENASTWSDLGILYRMVDNYPLAEKAYRHALTLSPNNLSTLNNLAVLLSKQGLVEEASAINTLVHNKRIKNPYYHAFLADKAARSGNYQSAQHHYFKAIKLNKTIHEFYYGLAKVYYQLDENERAQSALKKAIRLNKSRRTEHQYIAKLNWLEASERGEQ